jgi:hypothetical protein
LAAARRADKIVPSPWREALSCDAIGRYVLKLTPVQQPSLSEKRIELWDPLPAPAGKPVCFATPPCTVIYPKLHEFGDTEDLGRTRQEKAMAERRFTVTLTAAVSDSVRSFSPGSSS